MFAPFVKVTIETRQKTGLSAQIGSIARADKFETPGKPLVALHAGDLEFDPEMPAFCRVSCVRQLLLQTRLFLLQCLDQMLQLDEGTALRSHAVVQVGT